MTLLILGVIVLLVGIFGAKGESPMTKYKALIIIGGIIIAGAGVATAAIQIVNPGHVGVKVLFGSVKKGYLEEGLNVVNPLLEVVPMSVRTQNYTMSSKYGEGSEMGDDAIQIKSEDGLGVTIDLTILYRVMPTMAWQLFQSIGLDYEAKVIRAKTRTRIRQAGAQFKAVDLYSAKREEFEDVIKSALTNDFEERGLVLEDVLVRNIDLPQKVKESIERKLTAEQEQQRMEYVVQRERREAERKIIEANGQAKYQRILDSALTKKVIQYELIQVQKELVSSPNSKIIMMSGGEGAPPVIIGN